LSARAHATSCDAIKRVHDHILQLGVVVEIASEPVYQRPNLAQECCELLSGIAVRSEIGNSSNRHWVVAIQ